ncbi:MAG: lysophospholipid acyltransferase family protein [Dehalococcoidia bacterium]
MSPDPLHLYPNGTPLYNVMLHSLVPVFLSLSTDLHVNGHQHVPRSGPLIIISNHVDNLDTYVIGAQVPRLIHFFARSDGVHSRWLGLYWRLMAAVPADREGFNIALSLLRREHAIGVFSEGTISPSLVRAKAGVALLALRSGAPVLPCAVWGTERLLRGPGDALRRQPVHLRFGRPRTLKRGSGRAQDLADSLMGDVAAMLPPRYRGYYR